MMDKLKNIVELSTSAEHVNILSYIIIFIIHIILLNNYVKHLDTNNLYKLIGTTYMINLFYMIYSNIDVLTIVFNVFKKIIEFLRKAGMTTNTRTNTSAFTILASAAILEAVLKLLTNYIVANYPTDQSRKILIYLLIAKISLYTYIIYTLLKNIAADEVPKTPLKVKLGVLTGKMVDSINIRQLNAYINYVNDVEQLRKLLLTKEFAPIKTMLDKGEKKGLNKAIANLSPKNRKYFKKYTAKVSKRMKDSGVNHFDELNDKIKMVDLFKDDDKAMLDRLLLMY